MSRKFAPAAGAGFALAGALLAATTGAAVADESPMPPSGKFSITYTFTTSTPTSPIDIGGNRDLTVNNYLATMSNDQGGGFLHMVAGHCTNIRFTNRLNRTINTEAYCNFRDRDGDTLYAQYATGAPKPNTAIVNTWTFKSGTGKYLGLRGKGQDTNSNNIAEEGVYQAAGKLTGSYEIVRDVPATDDKKPDDKTPN